MGKASRSPKQVTAAKKMFAPLMPVCAIIQVLTGIVLHHYKPDLGSVDTFRAALILDPLNPVFVWNGMPLLFFFRGQLGQLTVSLLLPIMIPVALIAFVPLGLRLLTPDISVR
jgi:hypothetical protein